KKVCDRRTAARSARERTPAAEPPRVRSLWRCWRTSSNSLGRTCAMLANPAILSPRNAKGSRSKHAAVALFACSDAQIQPVFRRRQRTRGERREYAGRVVGLVEVDHETAVARRFGVEKTAGSVGFLAGGAVGEHQIQVCVAGCFDHRQ